MDEMENRKRTVIMERALARHEEVFEEIPLLSRLHLTADIALAIAPNKDCSRCLHSAAGTFTEQTKGKYADDPDVKEHVAICSTIIRCALKRLTEVVRQN